MSDYKTFTTAAAGALVEVRLYDETLDHVRSEHPEVPIELPSMLAAIESAIASPTVVEQSHSNSVVFMDTTTTNQSGDPLRIPVKLVTETSGRIKTVLFASPPTQGNALGKKDDA